MQTKNHKIFIYSALPCEAKPLIEFFRLKKQPAVKAFACYFGHEVCLTITGIGKNAMAAGVAYSQALFTPVEHPVLLNIGIAGHKQHSLGRLFVIHKITDLDSQKNYFPPLVADPPCPTESILTAAKPQLHYSQTHLCDMEASAFYETALRFSSGELVQCLKIISDNQGSPIENITPNQVSELIASQMSAIEVFIERLKHLAELITEPELELFETFLQRYHFTASESIQLKNRLRRWAQLTGRPLPEWNKTEDYKGRDVLRWLDKLINQTDFYL